MPIDINEMTDEELDAMSPERVAEISAQIWRETPSTEAEILRGAAPQIRVVGLGDSWFDYQPVGLDILDFLQSRRDIYVYDHGDAGDTLENMSYGTAYTKKFKAQKPRLTNALDDLKDSQAKIVLISGGGNDVAGKELEALLNHADTGLPTIRDHHLDFLIENVFAPCFEYILQEIWAIDSDVQIIGHGYGYAVPDGRAVIRFWKYSFIGPWFLPALIKKRILNTAEQQRIINVLVDRLNDLLIGLAAKYPNYHYLDFRPVLSPSDWENELHLKNAAFRRVADLFYDKIIDLTPAEPAAVIPKA